VISILSLDTQAHPSYTSTIKKQLFINTLIPSLPGCSSWGYSPQEASANIKDAAEVYVDDMIDAGEGLPQPSDRIELIEEPAITVSL